MATMSDLASIDIQQIPSPEPTDDLPESEAGSSSTEDDEVYTDAEREWRESLQQLELLLTMVLIPFLGKYFGRKMAYWSWGKVMEWKYPVEVVVTDRKQFNVVGAVEAASPL